MVYLLIGPFSVTNCEESFISRLTLLIMKRSELGAEAKANVPSPLKKLCILHISRECEANTHALCFLELILTHGGAWLKAREGT